MTLKDILDRVSNEAGFSSLATYAANTTVNAQQLVSLANRELAHICSDNWPFQKRTWDLTLTSATEYSFPDDYREMDSDTQFTNMRRAVFPSTEDTWFYFEARQVSSGLNLRMRVAGDKLQVQNPQAGVVVKMQYFTDHIVLDNDGTTTKKAFDEDADTFSAMSNYRIEDLFSLGVLWRFKKLKQLDWQADFQEYKLLYKREKVAANGARTINMGEAAEEWPNEPVADLLP